MVVSAVLLPSVNLTVRGKQLPKFEISKRPHLRAFFYALFRPNEQQDCLSYQLYAMIKAITSALSADSKPKMGAVRFDGF